MHLNHIDKHLLFFSLKITRSLNCVVFFYHSLSAEASFFLSHYLLPLFLAVTFNLVSKYGTIDRGVDVNKNAVLNV